MNRYQETKNGIGTSPLPTLPPPSLPSSHPFWVLDKVAPTGPLGDALRERSVLDGLFRPLDDVRELQVVWEMVEVPAVDTWRGGEEVSVTLQSGWNDV